MIAMNDFNDSRYFKTHRRFDGFSFYKPLRMLGTMTESDGWIAFDGAFYRGSTSPSYAALGLDEFEDGVTFGLRKNKDYQGNISFSVTKWDTNSTILNDTGVYAYPVIQQVEVTSENNMRYEGIFQKDLDGNGVIENLAPLSIESSDYIFIGDGTEGNDIFKFNRKRPKINGERVRVARERTLYLKGKSGDDFIVGGRVSDAIFGGKGDDTIRGGPGDDFLSGGSGSDMLIGGGGRNIFMLSEGNNIVKQFEPNYDSIGINKKDLDYEVTYSETSRGVLVELSRKDMYKSLLLEGTTTNQLNSIESDLLVTIDL